MLELEFGFDVVVDSGSSDETVNIGQRIWLRDGVTLADAADYLLVNFIKNPSTYTR